MKIGEGGRKPRGPYHRAILNKPAADKLQKPRVTRSYVDDVADEFASQEYSAFQEMWDLAKSDPRSITPYAFRKMVETTIEVAEQIRQFTEFGTRDNFGAEVIFLELLKDLPHYANLLAQVSLGRDLVHWLLFEKHQIITRSFDLMEEELGAMCAMDLEEETRRLESGGDRPGALATVSPAAITPVVTGIVQLDKMYYSPEWRGMFRDMLEQTLKLRPRQTTFITPELLAELAKLLKTDKRPGALRFLRSVAAEDLNLILFDAERYGSDLGEIIGVKGIKMIDPAIIGRNYETYRTENLFTAWAIGNRELNREKADEIKEAEQLVRGEVPAVRYRVVAAMLREKAPWALAEFKRLWEAPLFKETTEDHHRYIAFILALQGEKREIMVQLLECPGRLQKIFNSAVAFPHLAALMKVIRRVLVQSRQEIEARLDIINAFPFVLSPETYAQILTARTKKRAVKTLEEAIEAADYRACLSYGLGERVNAFGAAYREEMAKRWPKVTELTKTEHKQPAFMTTIAKVLEVPLIGAEKAKVEKAFRQLARECHPDRYPGDQEKETAFKMLNEAANIYLLALEEIASGKPTPDATVNLLTSSFEEMK
ncbi:MAG: DnaJ domain-containing protein [Candidatus Margulisiibacteriota bacterium]